MWIQLVLIAILFVVFLVVLFVRRTRENNVWSAYEVPENYDFRSQSDALYQPFDELFPVAAHIEDARLVMFSDYGDIDNNISRIPYPPRSYVYAIAGSDLMANKALLAKAFQESGLESYIPTTHILGRPLQLDEGKIYFLKKNVQRQEGTMITRDIKYIRERAMKDGYVVCQELLQDPMLVNGRKCNMRFYMLVVTNGIEIQIYYYKNGFMYYTPQMFKKDSTEKDVNVTTGYIDRKVYDENPLTHKDLYEWMGYPLAGKLEKNIHEFFRSFGRVYAKRVLAENKGTKNMRFNVFGVDIAPDEMLNVKIMEVNKAPDLSYKDERDAEVKLNMVKDMLSLVGIGNRGNPENFVMV